MKVRVIARTKQKKPTKEGLPLGLKWPATMRSRIRRVINMPDEVTRNAEWWATCRGRLAITHAPSLSTGIPPHVQPSPLLPFSWLAKLRIGLCVGTTNVQPDTSVAEFYPSDVPMVVRRIKPCMVQLKCMKILICSDNMTR